MKNIVYPVFIGVIILLVSCSAYKKFDLSKISIGMTKYEVIKKLGKNPKNVVGAKQYPKGIIEVLQYKRKEPWLGITTNNSYLYFLNDTLRQYGAAVPDWQIEADKIYQSR